MTNITLHIPDNVYELMKRHKEVRWSEVARRAIVDYTNKLKLLDRMVENSAVSLDDVMKLDENVKKAVRKRYVR